MAQDWLQGKSPKMWVNEICVKQLRQAKWETREAMAGRVPPIFICRCVIQYSDKTLEAEGSGKTKKDAEQEAALEMLKTKLLMTPAMLMSLNNSSKNKSTANSLRFSSTGSSSSISNPGASQDGDAVSDTDDKEINEANDNPVGELMAVCEQHNLQDPEYEEVNEEGPPHKRIFTVQCTVQGLGVKFTGRRYTKKVAKRVAAFRVLKTIKAQGYTYTPHTADEEMDNSGTKIDDNAKSEKDGTIKIERIPDVIEEDVLRKLVLNEPEASGQRRYCTDETEKCIQFCVDYSHAFQHLKKSITLDKVLTLQCTEPYNELGGPIRVLEQIALEIGIKLTMYLEVTAAGEVFAMLELKFPFKFSKTNLPNKAVVHALEKTKSNAKIEAAKNAINWMKSSFTSIP